MNDDFKNKYCKKHIMKDEFNILKKYINSFHNGKITNIDNFEYYPYIIIKNQFKFNPKLYDIINDEFIKPNYINYTCENCLNDFTNRDLYIQKNNIKRLCKSCRLCNYTFKIRHTNNYIGVNITYQSNLEYNFINYCNNNGIIVDDGPKIKYNWNNQTKTYYVDFYIKSLALCIEIKDYHIWHREQLKNGKWHAKMKSITNKLISKDYSNYILIFPNNFNKQVYLIKSLLLT